MNRLNVDRALRVVRASSDEKMACRRDALEVLLELAVATRAFRDAQARGGGAARLAAYVDGLIGELDFDEPVLADLPVTVAGSSWGIARSQARNGTR